MLVLAGIVILTLAALTAFAWYSDWSVRAEASEQGRPLPGDELIPNPLGSVNHAVTIRRAAHEVWPWLAQMGSGRAGWYGYDFIDNGGQPSADRIVPEYQDVRVGMVFPALPGAKDVFVVAECEPEKSLVLAWRLPGGQYQTTWTFALERPAADRTRLVVRGRVAPGYRPYGLPQWVATRLAPLAHAVMERKQLLEIKRRVEATP